MVLKWKGKYDKMMFNKAEILKYEEELKNNLRKLVSYKSTLDESNKDYPYGEEVAKCLDEVLNIAKNYGLRTKNLDNKCGYIEIGEGKETIGILTHLDVVDAGNGWDTNPFEATIIDQKIYGRGTSDDKGATVASLIALKMINDSNIKLNKKVRLILGCKEETGSECIKYYLEKEGEVDIGFTPDGRFPLVHGEKGHIRAIFKCDTGSDFKINGGNSDNAVSDFCNVEILKESYNKKLLEEYLKNNNIKYEIIEDGEKAIVKVDGVSAHGSTPEKGVNAISYMIMALKHAGVDNQLVNFYSNYIGLDTAGINLNIDCEDSYGKLTVVNGKIYQENSWAIGTLDIRVPVTLNSREIVDKLRNTLYDGGVIEIIKFNETTFYPLESKLVQTLLKVYQNITGDNQSQPITSGGGTYAKTMPNCIAFGCKFPNVNNNIHTANEYVEINELLLQVELYINAILELDNI